MKTKTTTKFRLGRLVVTRTSKESICHEDIMIALARHAVGDWGDCGEEDWKENDLSLKEGFRLFSVYRDRNGQKFWVITEADRSATTVLLPEDY